VSGLYYTDMLTVLRAAGLVCKENAITAGWQNRARSSGGFPAVPVCVFWHHTASQATPENDLNYMIRNSPSRPVGNMLIDRQGVCWPVAAGASNCAGKGGPMTFSNGSIPLDMGNTRGWQIEVANSGLGEPWPQVQIDAFFKASNAMNKRFGNKPTDITSHARGAGDGYTSRKIDPATAGAVQGPWRPRSTNTSGTWNLSDMRAEALRRSAPAPIPPSVEIPVEDDMQIISPPKRLYDTRQSGGKFKAGETRTIVLPGVAGRAAMLNLTAVPTDSGYMSAWASGPKPVASSLNFTATESVCNALPVPLAAGKITVFSSASAHLVIDLLGVWP